MARDEARTHELLRRVLGVALLAAGSVGLAGCGDDSNVDLDGDGLTGAVERQFGSDPQKPDTDADGLNDGEEKSFGSDPLLVDSDADGLSDAEEKELGSDPRAADSDGDGLDDPTERKLGTDPRKADTDDDGLSDSEEKAWKSDPLVADTDGDGLGDAEEKELGTAPRKADTDGDGASDGEEQAAGYDPKDSKSKPPRPRKTTPEAEAAFARFGELIHLPLHAGCEELSVTATAEAAMFGGRMEVNPTWTRQDGLSLDVKLPESLKEQYGEQGYEMFQSAATMMSREALAPAFEAPVQYATDYDLSHEASGGEIVVTLLPYSEDAATERQVVTYGADGFEKQRVVVLKIDPDTTDPMAQMLIGAELDTTYTYEKKGDRSAVTRMSSLTPMGELQVDYTYYELPDGRLLPRSATLVTPFTPQPVKIDFVNYKLDGKLVDDTKPQDE